MMENKRSRRATAKFRDTPDPKVYVLLLDAISHGRSLIQIRGMIQEAEKED